MADILLEQMIEAEPEKVFQALTSSEGIAGWWSNRAAAEPKLGSMTEVHFESGVMKMEITDLESGKNVQWKVRKSPHNWEGSTITWEITSSENGTKLLFGQRELFLGDAEYGVAETKAGWEYFLGSLKAYLETGTGTPYVY